VKAKARKVLAEVGRAHKMAAFPRELSGGEEQRVAIARAVVAEPSLVLADEPTAASDGVNGKAVMGILAAIAKKQGRAVLVVSHDARLSGFADRIVHIEDGMLTRRRAASFLRSQVTQQRVEARQREATGAPTQLICDRTARRSVTRRRTWPGVFPERLSRLP